MMMDDRPVLALQCNDGKATKTDEWSAATRQLNFKKGDKMTINKSQGTPAGGAHEEITEKTFRRCQQGKGLADQLGKDMAGWPC